MPAEARSTEAPNLANLIGATASRCSRVHDPCAHEAGGSSGDGGLDTCESVIPQDFHSRRIRVTALTELSPPVTQPSFGPGSRSVP